GEVVRTARGTSYRVDRRPRELGDFEGLAWWHSTSPGSRFMRSIIVSSTRPEGIATLFGRDEDGRAVTWYYRGVTDTDAREVTPEAAAEIAGEVFGLSGPLPQRVIRYAAVD